MLPASCGKLGVTACFLHWFDDRDALLDHQGHDLVDAAESEAAAIREARARIGAEALERRLDPSQRFEIEELGRAVVYRLAFVDAIEIVQPEKADRLWGRPPRRQWTKRATTSL